MGNREAAVYRAFGNDAFGPQMHRDVGPVVRIPPSKAALRHEPDVIDLNGACKSAARIRGSQSDGDHHRS